jgi:hypothetical protein
MYVFFAATTFFTKINGAIKVAKKFEEMSDYEGNWVALDFIRNFLKNARR